MTSINRKEKAILVGAAGNLGRALARIYCSKYNVFEHDLIPRRLTKFDIKYGINGKNFNPKQSKPGDMVEVTADPETCNGLVMNIAIPHTADFHKIMMAYNKSYEPSLVIIHSTVPPGTTRELNADGVPAVHSPCIFDENRFESMTLYRKMVGYNNPDLALKAESFLRPCFSTALVPDSQNTELSDISLNLYSMTCRAVTFEVARMFQIYGSDYRYMMELLQYHNLGYATMNKPNLMLQNMFPDLNKDDFRLALLDLLPEKIRSAFFKLAQRSYEIEEEKRQKKLKETHENRVAKAS